MSTALHRAARALLLLLAGVALDAPAQTLTLDDALARASQRNPGLSAADRTVRAAEHHAELVALPSPFTVGAEVENFGGTGALSGTSALESTVRLGRVVELGDKRAARAAYGGSQVAMQRNAAERRRLDLASEVRRRFVTTLERQERLAIQRRNVAAAEQVLATVTPWVSAGRSAESDRLQSEIAVLRARLAAEDAEHELDSARVALAALWGAPRPDFERVGGTLLALPERTALEALATRLPDTLDQRAFAHEAESLDAERRVARAGAVPDLSVSMGVRRLESVGDHALVLGLSLPLGTSRRAALEADRLGARRAAVDDLRDAARVEAYQRLYALHQELEHTRHAIELHRDQIIPKAESALALTRRAYDAGRSSFLLLSQAQQQLADMHTAQIEAAGRHHRLLIEIDRLAATGAPAP